MKLMFHGIKPVFVFDGDAPMLKKKTIVRPPPLPFLSFVAVTHDCLDSKLAGEAQEAKGGCREGLGKDGAAASGGSAEAGSGGEGAQPVRPLFPLSPLSLVLI